MSPSPRSSFGEQDSKPLPTERLDYRREYETIELNERKAGNNICTKRAWELFGQNHARKCLLAECTACPGGFWYEASVEAIHAQEFRTPVLQVGGCHRNTSNKPWYICMCTQAGELTNAGVMVNRAVSLSFREFFCCWPLGNSGRNF